jgi:hypothetical protein
MRHARRRGQVDAKQPPTRSGSYGAPAFFLERAICGVMATSAP